MPNDLDYWCLEQRYRDEPLFRQLVDIFHATLCALPFSEEDIDDILSLALHHYGNDLRVQHKPPNHA